MTTGLILIAAVLVLGGVIASVGDRIGTKVGKARLSLFNLRPKNTAVLVTLLTGSLISGSTLAVLFAASDQLRTGVFKLETIQKNLKNARQEVEQTRAAKNQLEAEKNQLEIAKNQVESQKSQVEEELAKAKSEQAAAQKRLDETNQSLQAVLAKLSEAVAKQALTEGQLNQTVSQLSQTQQQLSQTQDQLKIVSQQATDLRSEIAKLQSERKDLIAQRDFVRAQISELKAQLDQRDRKIAERDRQIVERDRKVATQDREIAERDKKIAAQDQKISQREQEISQRDREIELRDRKIASQDRIVAQQETRLKSLETKLNDSEVLIAEREKLITEKEKQLNERGKQLYSLQQEVATLEQYYQDYQALRGGNVRLLRGQVLASGVVRIVDPKAARTAVDQLLLQANRSALQRIRPGDKNLKEQVILIRETEVKNLIEEIKDGSDYVVRIISSGNYVIGESPVQVFADVVPNRVVFQPGEVLATTSADPAKMTDDQLRERIEQLIAASQFKARRAGIVASTMQIGDDRIETLTRFLEQLKQSKEPVDVQLVASDVTYTAGPVKMDLVALVGGQIIFRTSSTG